jgi:hypothetical protein
MADGNDQTEEAREPHEHDAAAWAKHREAQHQPYRQPELGGQGHAGAAQRVLFIDGSVQREAPGSR